MKLQPIAVVMEHAEQMVLVNVKVNSSQLIVQVSYNVALFSDLELDLLTFFHSSQHFVILIQHATAKEVVELMGIANVRMAYLGKIAQVNLQIFRVYKMFGIFLQVVVYNKIFGNNCNFFYS